MNALRQRLKESLPSLYDSLLNSWQIAESQWLPTMPNSKGSFNSKPHLLNVENHANSLLYPQGVDTTSLHPRVDLTPLECYLLLAAVLFHDIGRSREAAEREFWGEDKKDKEDQNDKISGRKIYKHAHYSREMLIESPSALGIPSLSIAESLGRIVYYHDPEEEEGEIEKARNELTEVTIEPYGRAREIYIATILALADHMDGSLKRVMPNYVQGQTVIGFKGAFRSLVTGTYYDHATQTIKTSLKPEHRDATNIRSKDSLKDHNFSWNNFNNNKENESPESGKSKTGSDTGAEREKTIEKLKSNSSCGLLESYISENEAGKNEVFWETLERSIKVVPIPPIKSNETNKHHWPTNYLLAVVLNDLYQNHKFLKKIRADLADMGLPVSDWFVEWHNNVYDHVGQLACEETIRLDLLMRILFQMRHLSQNILRSGPFSYETLADAVRESRVDLVRIASKKLANWLPDTINAGTQNWRWIDRKIALGSAQKVVANKYPEKKHLPGSGSHLNNTKGGNNQAIAREFEKAQESNPEEEPESPRTAPARKRLVDLGPVVNHLIDDRNKLQESSGESRGLFLPPVGNEKSDDLSFLVPPTGAVVIQGHPGAGKSTFALQILARAAMCGHHSALLALEEDGERIMAKSNAFGWQTLLRQPKYLSFNDEDLEASSQPRGVLDPIILKKIITSKTVHADAGDDDNEMGCIILPSLLPRPLHPNEPRFFSRQYQQIEALLRASKELADTGEPSLRILAIDSLNVLCEPGHSREQIYRIFDLCRECNVLGIFTTEDNSNLAFDSTTSDLVIRLSRGTDPSYVVNYLSVEKSRYTPHTRGKHPYKIKNRISNSGARLNNKKTGLYVFPSVHTVIAATEKKSNISTDDRFPFGWDDDVTNRLTRRSLTRPSVVALVGPPGTFKRTIAINFLRAGLSNGYSAQTKIKNDKSKPERVLLIRFQDPPSTKTNDKIKSYETVSNDLNSYPTYKGIDKPDLGGSLQCSALNSEIAELQKLIGDTKAEFFTLTDSRIKDPENEFIVIDFKTGMLLPEEFVEIVRLLMESCQSEGKDRGRIQRVVMEDIGAIGVSYPLLRKNETTGDLFLSGVVHVMRNYGVDLMLVGTTGNLKASNTVVDQATVLADCIIQTDIRNVYGNRFVLLSGDGLNIHTPLNQESSLSRDRSAPAVITLMPTESGSKSYVVDVNISMLEGFTGFEEGASIRRPGVRMLLFQETEQQKFYNESLKHLLQTYRGTLNSETLHDEGSLNIETFSPDTSMVLHRSKSSTFNLEEGPQERTVLRMYDEFAKVDGLSENEELLYKNVLLLAYRDDYILSRSKKKLQKRRKTWEDIYDVVREIKIPEESSEEHPCKRQFWYDLCASETRACMLMDAIASTNANMNLNDLLNNPYPSNDHSTKVALQLEALYGLMHMTGTPKSQMQRSNLVEDSAVYVCWYSQLRDLLFRKPELSGLIRVAALPGRGFKGDWYLKLLPGSASYTLGDRILRIMTSPEEDYRRFSDGVGLPVGERFKNTKEPGFLAWTGAHRDVTMNKIFEIHENAHSRSSLRFGSEDLDYKRFSTLFSTICNIFATPSEEVRKLSPKDRSEYFKYHAKRIPNLMSIMASEQPKGRNRTMNSIQSGTRSGT